jgi:hypothetical protein
MKRDKGYMSANVTSNKLKQKHWCVSTIAQALTLTLNKA